MANSNDKAKGVSRRNFLKGAAGAAGAVAVGSSIGHTHWMARAQEYAPLGNYPVNGPDVVLGFNVPQTGPYSDEGADELRAYELAVKHLNGEGDGGMMNTMQPSSLSGEGILGKRVTFVTGDTETNSAASRDSARRMIERDKAIMISGGSSSVLRFKVFAKKLKLCLWLH